MADRTLVLFIAISVLTVALLPLLRAAEGDAVHFLKAVGLAILGLVVLAFVGVGALFAYYTMQPKSYDECVVADMRGQDQSVIENVRAVCQRKFGVLLEVAAPAGQWNWSNENGKLVVMLLSPFSNTYRVSRIEARVSPDQCNAIGAQWSPVTLWSTSDYAAEALFNQPSTCMQIDHVFAYRQ